MFFILSKTIGYLVYPLSLALLALLFSRWRRKRQEKRAAVCFWLGFVILWLCSMPWGTDALLRPLEEPYRNQPPPAGADAILVLGGALDLAASWPGHLEYNQGADRFLYSLKLAKQYPKAVVIYAGGTADLFDKSKTEASLLRQEAIEFGLAPERLFVDDRSRNTRENMVEARRILQQTGGSTVLLVTSAFHMPRSMGCARKVGINAVPYPVDFRGHYSGFNRFGFAPEAGQLVDSTAAIREYVGLVMYRLQGYR